VIGLDVGAAWSDVTDACGRVRAVFRRAIHLHLDPGGLLMVVAGDAPPGPLHLRVDTLPAVAAGDRAALVGGRLHLGRGSVDVRAVPAWTPPAVALGHRLAENDGAQRVRPAVADRAGGGRSALVGRDDLVGRVRDLLRVDDLGGAARLLGGWGPGLTPAGDDVLAGIVLTMHGLGVPEDRLRAAVDHVRSTDLAVACLRWAAGGQCIEPAHDVLAAVSGRDPDRLAAAEARLAAHGATSGADLLFGIDLALRTAATPATLP
jgi:Protein of unknown function (DUF2877)